MITPKITGAIITALVIILGVALLYPALRVDTKFGVNEETSKETTQGQMILLTFNIVNSSQLPTWCHNLSHFLTDNNIHSTVFITGIIADTYPDCVSSFSNDIDIGSMSYTNQPVTEISTYPTQLSQITEGKRAVDEQGKLNSTLFRAPFGIVDENIYSLLSRAHILADFSYIDHYNLYTDGRSGKTFYWFPIRTLNNLSTIQGSNTTANLPLMVNFYNYDALANIESYINSTKSPYKFVTASELTNIDLTIR